MKFWCNDALEARSAGRLVEFEAKTGRKLAAPIPIDLVAEVVFDLRFLYDGIDAPPGHRVLGCLSPSTRTITLNERERALFDAHRGLDRFTMGHEIGHWDLFEQHATDIGGTLFGDAPDSDRRECRTTKSGLAKFIAKAGTDALAYEVIDTLRRSVDAPEVASAVDRYASALLMPKALLLPAAEEMGIDLWKNLYALAERFGVTISAMRVRLSRLGKVQVTKDGKLFKGTKEEMRGQQRMY